MDLGIALSFRAHRMRLEDALDSPDLEQLMHLLSTRHWRELYRGLAVVGGLDPNRWAAPDAP